MGTSASTARVTPVVAQISVMPKDAALDISSGSQYSGGAACHSSEDTLKKDPSRTSSTSRPGSNLSGRKQSDMRRGMGPGGPGAVSVRQWSEHGYRIRSGGAERLKSPTTTSGLPFLRDMENADLSTSQRSQRVRTVGHLFQEISAPENDMIFLRMDPGHAPKHPASCCQLCGNGFTNLGVRTPLLLLCGHSYCSSCLEKACESCDYPVALKCGVCLIVTPLEQLSPKSLPQNEAILDLVGSKEYTGLVKERAPEACAECVERTASLYCSECVASYCEVCGRKAHEGSRVRAKHKPVSITLKPYPQPTCKKHPGQSCVLYCETEKLPMCVLCKFYNQHKFHKFELMSKVASKYNTYVSEKLKQLEQLEKDFDGSAQSLYAAVSQINQSATKIQERLEKHFTDMKKTYLAALERREAMLLNLVDRQVDMKQEILAEMRLEVAAARARVIAAHEEATKLSKLNPVTALLSRRHMDLSLETALRQMSTSSHFAIQPDVPLSLLPDITSGMIGSLNQHGAILQLPPKPYFTDIQVAAKAISLQWRVHDQNTDVSSDRTMTFSLHCYGDIPYKLERKLTLIRKRMRNLITPESGFEDMSEMSSDSKSTFPSLPPSLLGSRNVSTVAHYDHDMNTGELSRERIIREESEENETTGVEMPSLLPEPIRLPIRRNDSKLPQLVLQQSANASLNLTNPDKAPNGSGILNLPPLIISKQDPPLQLLSMQSVATTSGVFGDTEEGRNSPRVGPGGRGQHQGNAESISLSSDLSGEVKLNEYTELGRFCQGYAFEEIYCGEDTSFQYSGLVAGASYFFRVQCHNAAGWGPWSDTVKCMTNIGCC